MGTIAEGTVRFCNAEFGVAAEAAEILTSQGTKTNVLAIRNIMPFKSDQIATMLNSAKKLLLVECNYTAQMARMIRAETGIEIKDKFLKYNGEPIYPSEIVRRVKEVVA